MRGRHRNKSSPSRRSAAAEKDQNHQRDGGDSSEFPVCLSPAPIFQSPLCHPQSAISSLVFLGALLLHVAGTWIIPLVDRDEPRFAEASREMRERGDYVIPYFNDKYRFDKPPFIYWTQIASYRLFGENDFAARFPSAVAAALTAVAAFRLGPPRGRRTHRLVGGDHFHALPANFVHAKAAVADMWLVFFVTAASWAGYELLARLARAGTPPCR